MKYNFTNYTRIDGSIADYEKGYITDQNKNYKNSYVFRPELFQKLINERRYEEAVEYGRKFKRNDPYEDEQFQMQLYNIAQDGRYQAHFYSQLQNAPETLAKSEFYNNVFLKNGLSTLVNREGIADNAIAKSFLQAKRNFGSKLDENGNVINEATRISVTFKPANDGFWRGVADFFQGTDSSVDYLQQFYSQSGLTEQALKANGVNISFVDGNTTITFDKSSPIANQMLYGLGFDDAVKMQGTQGGLTATMASNAPIIKSYDINGREIQIEDVNQRGYHGSGTFLSGQARALLSLKNFKATIDNAKAEYDKAKAIVSKADGNYKGFAIPMTDEEIKAGALDKALRQLGSGDTRMYSNNGNKPGDETLRFVGQATENSDSNEREDLINYIGANADKVTMAYAMYGDEVGTLITVDAFSLTNEQAKGLDKDMKAEDAYHGRRIHVFIPGLNADEAKASINSNSDLRAEYEANNMQKYGHAFKLSNDRKIMYDGNGSYIYQDNYDKISQDEATLLIHKTQLIEDSQFLKYNYINDEGTLFDSKGFDKQAREYAISSAMSLYPNVLSVTNDKGKIAFNDKLGNTITVEDIFSKKGGNNTVLDKYAKNMDYKTLQFYKDCFDIYMAIINNASFYK